MMEAGEGFDRRLFLVGGFMAAAGSWGSLGGLIAWSGSAGNPCARATSVATFAGPKEKGEPLHVTGRVFAADGVSPAAGVMLYAYHTDAKGHYSRWPFGTPRLRGWMRTGADGRYEYRTIKPAPYPGRRNAAHVHTQLWGERVPPQYGTDLLFEGDPYLTAEQKRLSAELGRFAFIRPLERDGRGVWHAVHDLRLKPAGDRFEGNTRQGLAPCGDRP